MIVLSFIGRYLLLFLLRAYEVNLRTVNQRAYVSNTMFPKTMLPEKQMNGINSYQLIPWYCFLGKRHPEGFLRWA